MGLIRDTCSFFRSIYEGSKKLKPAERLEIYETIFGYMFYDNTVDEDSVKPSTYLAFTSNKKAFDNAKSRYDKQKENAKYGEMGARYGSLGGRGKKKTPENPLGGLSETPENPQDIEEDIDILSKKVSKCKNAHAPARESYKELLTRLGFSDVLQCTIFEFIQFQQANGKIITNTVLEHTMTEILQHAEIRIREGLGVGDTNKDLAPYKSDIEGYIAASIRQALSGGWFTLKPPTGYETDEEFKRRLDRL